MQLFNRLSGEPLWWDDAAFPEARGDIPAEADVVVAGAGYTGVAAALELRARGRDVLVLDGQRLGRGASGRNAGMVHAGLRFDLDTLERRLGPRGRALHQASVDAYRFAGVLAQRVAPDAGFRADGWLYLAHRSSRMGALRAREVSRRRAGEHTRILEAAQLNTETACRGLSGGLLTDNGASVQPARYLAGMQRAALTAGACIVEETPVTRVERRGTGFAVCVPDRTIIARDVLVATNGYTDAAFPELRRRVIPIGSYIVATEPLDAELASSVSRGGRVMSDTRNFLHYWRLSPDRRMVFGGRTSFAPVSVPRAAERLQRAMHTIYPQLRGVRITHAWTGNVGFTFDQLPHMGRRSGIAYAMGYCGSGVAMGTWLGTLAGAWLANGERNPFLDRRFPTLPGYRGNPWFLPAVGVYYQLRDHVR